MRVHRPHLNQTGSLFSPLGAIVDTLAAEADDGEIVVEAMGARKE